MVGLSDSMKTADARIPRFYAGRTIFITGATGFMGKVLLERLLATCPDITRLYLLVRTKKGLTPEQRLQRLKESQVFDVVRQSSPAQLEKLVILPGDITQPALALSRESIALLKEVSIVFHSAATLKFDQPALRAVQENLLPVMELLKICDQLPQLQAFIHVSTAYSNSELSMIEERVYSPPAPLDKLLIAAKESTSDEDFVKKIHEYKAKKTNMYTFTKAMAETSVYQHARRGYPLAIFRPTIVISSMEHPFPGWIENLNGPSGVVVGTGKGLLHAFHGDPAAAADLLPVDIAIDTLMAVAWETTLDNSEVTRVYNCSMSENPITWGQFREKMLSNNRRYPFDNVIWFPFGYVIHNWYVFKTLEFLLMTLPNYTAVYFAKAFAIKMRLDLTTACYRISAMVEVLQFFGLREWRFGSENVKKLRGRLHPADAKIYNLNPQSIKWDKHIRDFVIGVRKYLLKEKDEDIEKARRHLTRMYILHILVQVSLITVPGWLLYRILSSFIS